MADKKNRLDVVLSIMDKATAPLQAFAKRIDKLQEPVRKVGNKLSIFSKAAGFKKLGEAASGVGEAFGKVGEEAKSLALKAFAGVGALSGAMFGLVKMTANAGNNFANLAQKAGVSADFMQKAAYAASFADVESEALSGALAKMNQNIVAANMGSKEMQTWFRRAGVSAKDLKTMRPEEIFTRVLAELEKLPKESAKAGSLASAIFGDVGKNMLPMASGFKELSDEAEEFGLVLGGDTIKAGIEFNDTIARLLSAVKGLGYAVGSMLLPYFQEIASALMEWAKANREVIATKIEEWVRRLRDHWPQIKEGIISVWDVVQRLGRALEWFIGAVGGVGNALIVVAAIISRSLIFALASAAAAVAKLGLALLATPVGWIIGAIAAVAASVYLIYDNWDAIAGWFSELWGSVKEIFSNAWAWFKETLSWHPVALVANNWDGLKDYFSELWSWISGLFSEQIDKITGWLKKLDPTQYVKGAWDWVTSPFSGDDEKDPMAGSVMQGVSMGAPAGVSSRAVETAQARMFGGAGGVQTNNAKVEVDFKNVPRGVEVTPGSNNTAPLDLSMGYQMVTP